MAVRRPARRRRLWLWLSVVVLGALLAAGGFITLRMARPVPAPQVAQTMPRMYTIPGTAPALPWPQAGQATVEVEGLGAVGSSGESRPVPIASVAKVMTAYIVLRDRPLRPDEDGPSLTVSAEEAAAYPAQLASGQSLVQVVADEVLTERQALQALLLPSANNIAYILARWDAGSSTAFVAKMNQTAAQLGMTRTRYTDPSGLDPATVSTSTDQARLARAALALPALAQIVAMPQAILPVVGLVKNVNTLLGADGIVGVKTGSTDEAGGCLLFAAELSVEGHRLRIIGAVFGAGPAMADAFAASQRLVQAASGLPRRYRVVHAGQVVATVRGPMGRSIALATTKDVDVLGWPGLSYRVDTLATVPDRVAAAADVGTLKFTAADAAITTGLRTTGALTPPNWWERLTHG